MMNQHQSLVELWNFGERHLKELRRPYGFAAGNSDGYYAALFGRDSLWILISLLEAAHLHPWPPFIAWVEDAAADIISSLCELQGSQENDLIEEQPGKIIHEFRDQVDERIQGMGIAFENGRSYSGFDTTFLFVIAFCRFSAAYPTNPIVERALPNFEGALKWIESYADEDGDGLFEYRRRNTKNLLNQVWKDSFDSIVQTGADVPQHPIAWIEVQCYAYRALLDAADLYHRNGKEGSAERYRSKAKWIQKLVSQRYWLTQQNYFALALDARKSPVTMLGSNVAHALWSGIVLPEQAQRLVDRLLEPDMTTPYGLRTLSSKSPFYAPFSYHRGNVWPFDNGIWVAGLFRHGNPAAAIQVMQGITAAFMQFGSPVEMYVVLDGSLFLSPRLPAPEALLFPRANFENRNQGTSAATALYFAAALAKIEGVGLHDG